MPNVKWTAAELAIWNILLVAAGAGVMGGIPALMQYLASTNVDVVFCLKLALAGGASAFGASILTYFRKNGLSVAIQAILDALGQLTALTSQVHDAVTTQVVATPQPVPAPPQPIVLAPQPASTTYVPPVFAQPIQPQQPLYMPNLSATATAAPPAGGLSFVPNLGATGVSSATSTVPWVPPSSDIRFGDTGIVPVIPKP